MNTDYIKQLLESGLISIDQGSELVRASFPWDIRERDPGKLEDYKKRLKVLGLEVSQERPDLTDYMIYHIHSGEFRDVFYETSLDMILDISSRLSGVFLVSDDVKIFLEASGVVYTKNLPEIWRLDRDEVLKIIIP